MIQRTNKSSRQRARRIRAEAAVWFARLQGSDCNAATEEGFRRWRCEDPDHATQYKIATGVWNDPAQCLSQSTRRGIARPVLAIFAACLVLAAVAGGVIYWMLPDLSTAKGERLSTTLADGTRVELNTDTHVALRYGAHERKIILQSGEIYLNVIKHEPRPFVVVAGDRKVVATGTSFVVRRDVSSVMPLSVTLIEGCVAIEPTSTRESSQIRGASEATILSAGRRARFRHGGAPILDTPSIDQVTSWRQGELIFTNMPLPEAVYEFNRYSLNRITVRSPEAESIRVSGVYRTEDSLSFIRTVAQDQHMRFQVQDDELILESVPENARN
jgi:transmembrane sensor